MLSFVSIIYEKKLIKFLIRKKYNKRSPRIQSSTKIFQHPAASLDENFS